MADTVSSPLVKEPQKFHFADLDLEREMEERAAARRYDDADIAKAVAEAEARGHAAGHAEAMANIEAATARIIPDILAAAQELSEEQARQKGTLEAEAIRLARLITGKVLPVFVASKAYDEIEALITACLADRSEEARIIIRLPDAILDKIQSRLQNLAEKTGFAGKPVLLADPSLGETQARVEWANGGADWDYAAQLGDIEAAAKRLVSAKPVTVQAAEIESAAFSVEPAVVEAELVSSGDSAASLKEI